MNEEDKRLDAFPKRTQVVAADDTPEIHATLDIIVQEVCLCGHQTFKVFHVGTYDASVRCESCGKWFTVLQG